MIMLNERAIAWAVTQTELNLQDLRALISAASLLRAQDDDSIMSLADKLAVVFQIPAALAVDSVDHLERCAFITKLWIEDGAIEHRLNYMQAETIRLYKATRQNPYRPLPASLFEQHQLETDRLAAAHVAITGSRPVTATEAIKHQDALDAQRT